ncbi:MAG: hypothetical protein P8Y00_09765 [Deltaproteobacteria bacterium]
MKKFVRAVDAFTDFTGRWFSLLILPMIFVVMYEVIARKIFHAPTEWGFEMMSISMVHTLCWAWR